jgi:hypothetical protein
MLLAKLSSGWPHAPGGRHAPGPGLMHPAHRAGASFHAWTVTYCGAIVGLRLTNQPGPFRVPGSRSLNPARAIWTARAWPPAGVCLVGLAAAQHTMPPRRTRPAPHYRRGPVSRPYHRPAVRRDWTGLRAPHRGSGERRRRRRGCPFWAGACVERRRRRRRLDAARAGPPLPVARAAPPLPAAGTAVRGAARTAAGSTPTGSPAPGSRQLNARGRAPAQPAPGRSRMASSSQ